MLHARLLFNRCVCILVAVIVVVTISLEAQAVDPIKTVQSYSLNVFEQKLDGQWQGAMVASDGNVYFGGSTHSNNAAGHFSSTIR